MNKKDTLVFLNGELLPSYEYSFPNINRIIFKTPLNSQSWATFANVIIVENGIKIYESKIEEQNIRMINWYSGEISE